MAENAYGFIKTTYFPNIAHTRSHEGTEGTWRIFLAGSETSLKTAVPGAGQPVREAQREEMAQGYAPKPGDGTGLCPEDKLDSA